MMQIMTNIPFPWIGVGQADFDIQYCITVVTLYSQ